MASNDPEMTTDPIFVKVAYVSLPQMVSKVEAIKECCITYLGICDPLSQNEHKVATAAIQSYYRFKFSIMQALKWYMICGYSFLFCLAKTNILC